MKIKMVALRRHYHAPDKREYEAGQWFNVSSEVEADRLVRMRRANRDVPKAAQKPPVKTKVMAPETDAAPAAQTAVAAATTEDFKPLVEPDIIRGNRYRRNDMRSED